MSNIRETDFYKNMTPFRACECAEGFGSGEDASRDEQIAAWQYIHDTGLWKTLQGFYGRTLHALINEGLIDTKGN